jgi:SAM-dependent methyltransferase
MTTQDREYLAGLRLARLIHSPCLEVGAGSSQHRIRDELLASGIEWVGTDIFPGNGVTVVVDLEAQGAPEAFRGSQFGSVLCCNVLEHTFDPIRVLDNCLALIRPGGTLVVITPCVWPLHDYPYDCWRINPHWYEQYARRRKLALLDEHFVYVGVGRVKGFVASGGAHYAFPRPGHNHSLRYWWSKVVHRALGTFGRGMWFSSHLAVGAVFGKDQAQA